MERVSPRLVATLMYSSCTSFSRQILLDRLINWMNQSRDARGVFRSCVFMCDIGWFDSRSFNFHSCSLKRQLHVLFANSKSYVVDGYAHQSSWQTFAFAYSHEESTCWHEYWKNLWVRLCWRALSEVASNKYGINREESPWSWEEHQESSFVC